MAKARTGTETRREWLVVYGSLMRGLPARETLETHAARTASGHAPRAETTAGPPAASATSATTTSRDLLDQLGVAAGLRRVGPCRVPGRLFDLGAYPALRPASDPADRVCGELHALLDPGVFGVLDAFEGFDPLDPVGSDYLRERVTLVEPAGVDAWIYVYNREPEPARRVPSGDWRAHLAERGRSAHDPEERQGGTARWDS
jgi:gamma-glutamylcyclotransferase (GGCT)/AIG2-like uncharacterized protein YtfP